MNYLKALYKNTLLKLSKSKIFIFIDQLIYRINTHNISQSAALMTYYFILSVFPFIITLLSVVSFIDINLVNKTINLISNLPDEISKILLPFASDLVKTSSGSLFGFALLGALFTSSSGLTPAISSINNSFYSGSKDHNFIIKRLLSIIFIIFLIFAIIINFAFTIFGDYLDNLLNKYIQLPEFLLSLLSFKNLISFGIILLIFISFFYFSLKDKKEANIKLYHMIPGSLFTSVGIYIFSYLFSVYVNNFSKYTITYGSLGAVIVFLVWLYLVNNLILIANDINASFYYLQKNDFKLDKNYSFFYKSE